MSLDLIETWLQWAGAAALAAFLAWVFVGMARALRRPRGRVTGLGTRVLRGPVYLLIGVLFFAVAYVLWRPLPLTLSPPLHAAALALGALIYFPGLALALWGRLTLGAMYNVSMSVGVQLHAGHRLITTGPYALVRHPMYLGIILAAWGGLLLYRTWTCVFAACVFLGLVVRARREEQALAAEFGAECEAYRRRVPGWLPRLRRR
jgi:protein-S-isoprenylcysteine O-methyltransferase Ste14